VCCLEPMLPTCGYCVLCHDATLIDVEAEGMWPNGTQLDFTVTVPMVGLPRTVVVQRSARADVDLLVREDLAVGPPSTRSPPQGVSSSPVGGARDPLSAKDVGNLSSHNLAVHRVRLCRVLVKDGRRAVPQRVVCEHIEVVV